MNYKNYSTVDFINDSYFVKWVKEPDAQSDQFWSLWMQKNPDKREAVMHAKKMLVNMKYSYDPVLSEEEYVDLFEGILQKSRSAKSTSRYFLSRSALVRVAAVIAFLLTSVFVYYSIEHAGDTSAAVKVTRLTKVSPQGQKVITWLSDGTKVHLNSGSVLEYPSTFADSKREVYLKGEAFFEVTKDNNRPFMVNSEEVKTTVLGTEFNVRAYPDEDHIAVAVREGKVAVSNAGSLDQPYEHIITANQKSTYSKSDKVAVKERFDDMDVFSWTRGVLIFKNANTKEIFQTLERWYGVRFQVNRTLNPDKDFSFSYNNKPLSEIMEGLSFAFGFEYTIDDKTIIIN